MSTLSSIFKRPLFTKAVVTLYDALLGGLCMYAAIKARYALENKAIPSNIDENAAIVFAVTCVIVWVVTRMHKAIWRFTSLDDVKNLLQGVILVSIITPLILFIFFSRAQDFPRSVPFIAGGLFFLSLTLNRMLVLFAQNGDVRAIFRGHDKNLPGALIVGSDASLHNYLRDMRRKASGMGFNIIGLINTDSNNRGRSIRSYPILGSLDDIKPILQDITRGEGQSPTLIAADKAADRLQSHNLVKLASELGAPLVRVSNGPSKSLTPFEAADLIGRNVKALDIAPVKRLITGKRVMITGAGGTIGSEIACQVAGLNPERLILVDYSEFNLYEIERKLARDYAGDGEPYWFPYLANICDRARLSEVFELEKPEIILHAAALKHVHLSEVNPGETLRTNLGGTKNLLTLALEHETKSFTLISTDKAVNPSNIMGASKRVAEMLTMAHDVTQSGMSACAVRFGNVLASTGSVVPLFEEQIANGGPVTVTHKDVKRFFMTVEEAAALVLQAAALNSTQHPELASIYVLEMGEPVKIAKLARQLIRLRGLVPDRDIKIEFTNLREGEKLEEGLTSREEALETTYVEGISRISGRMSDPKSLARNIDRLMDAVNDRRAGPIKTALKALVPTYTLTEELPEPKAAAKSADIIPLADSNVRK